MGNSQVKKKDLRRYKNAHKGFDDGRKILVFGMNREPKTWFIRERVKDRWCWYTEAMKWSVERHRHFPNEFQMIVETFLLCLVRLNLNISKDVRKMIICMLAELIYY